MRGVLLDDGRLTWREDLPLPEPGPGEALIKVRLAGLCGTDLAMLDGYAGLRGVPGHEFVGEVVRVAGDGTTRDKPAEMRAVGPGRRVVGSINIGCGSCPVCSGPSGPGPAHCPERRVLGIRDHDGAFADYLTLPLVNLHPVPDALSDRQAVFVEPLAAALRVLDHFDSLNGVSGARAVVVGPGRLGLLVAQVLRGAGAEVVVIGRSQASLAMPRALGFVAGDSAPAAEFDIAVETSGQAAGLDRALDLVRPRGTVVLKSTYATAPAVDLSRVVINELALLGSRCGPFERALEWLAEGWIDTEPLIDGAYPLAEFAAAYRRAGELGVRKVLLTFD